MASEIKVDTISEKTSANGVTIDGVNIKDSALATAGSVPLSTIDIDGGTDTVSYTHLTLPTIYSV